MVSRIDELLAEGRARSASDLHLAPGEPPVFRVDGALVRASNEPLRGEAIEAFVERVFPPSRRSDFENGGDADTRHDDALGGALRVHAFRAAHTIRLAIRFLAAGIPTFETLGLPAALAPLAHEPHGLILFVGPTGSGKSTTLAALIERINRAADRHIISVEDPVEYVHRPARGIVAQRELGRDTPTFASAVRAALRADPDVIAIGELRERAAMRVALRAAETGHLVLATVHAADAAQTIDRIADSFSSDEQRGIRGQLAAALRAVVALRLVPRASGSGRLAALEILHATDAVRAIVREGKTHLLRNAIATGRASGMMTLETHLSELVTRGEVTYEAARAAASVPADVRILAEAAR